MKYHRYLMYNPGIDSLIEVTKDGEMFWFYGIEIGLNLHRMKTNDVILVHKLRYVKNSKYSGYYMLGYIGKLEPRDNKRPIP